MRARWLAVVLPLLTGCGYNTIQTLDEQSNAAKHEIEVQLQRRADLVPQLVATVKGLAQPEQDLFVNVAKARAGVMSAVQRGDPAEMANADASLNSAIGRLLVVAEQYPQLKSDQAFIRLQDELAGTENRIARSRQDYNQAVREYNTYIRRFPASITAKVTGAKPRVYFEVTNPDARDAPTVDFSKPADKK